MEKPVLYRAYSFTYLAGDAGCWLGFSWALGLNAHVSPCVLSFLTIWWLGWKGKQPSKRENEGSDIAFYDLARRSCPGTLTAFCQLRIFIVFCPSSGQGTWTALPEKACHKKSTWDGINIGVTIFGKYNLLQFGSGFVSAAEIWLKACIFLGECIWRDTMSLSSPWWCWFWSPGKGIVLLKTDT